MGTKTLISRPHGALELRSSDDELLWSSDADEDFAEEFPDFVDIENDPELEDVSDYLIDIGVLADDEEITITVEDLDDSDDDDDDDDSGGDVIEGDFTDITPRRLPSKSR
jgi:hypothetical protein